MKKFLAAVLAVFLLAGCSNGADGTDGNNAGVADTSETTLAPVPEETTTTARVSAVEDQPENTSTAETGESGTTPAGDSEPEAFPPPYPSGSVDDPQMLSEFKTIIQSAETAESVLDGEYTLIPLGSGDGDYRMISPDYAEDMDDLTDRMYEGFKYSFWEDHYGDEVENMLPSLIKEVDGGIALYCGTVTQPYLIDVSSAVITYLTEYNATVVALGTLGDKYIWRTYDLLNGVRGWVVQEHSDETVTGEIAMFSQLLITQRSTLDTIFGNVTPIPDSNGDWNPQLVTIDDDIYGHGFYNGLEIQPFMTVEEMRQYLRDTFTSEIAESYISLYVNRTYVEKEGKLYIISGSILPQMGEFSLANYENRSISSYDVTSLVEWTDGDETYTLPITITYEGGRWKLDTRLPMMKDRVIS